MSKYLVSIEPFRYTDTAKEISLSPDKFATYSLTTGKSFDRDRIDADVTVRLNPTPSDGPVVCELDPDKKLALFTTNRETQVLDLYLKPVGGLKGRVFFLKAEVVDPVNNSQHCSQVEYFHRVGNLKPHPIKFGVPIPKAEQVQSMQLRLTFSMKGKVDPFDYKIYIVDTQGDPTGEDCDPQTSNDPPTEVGS